MDKDLAIKLERAAFLLESSANPFDEACAIIRSVVNHEPQSLIDQIKAIPWAPWVKWVAMDKYGSWYAYSCEPTYNENGWYQAVTRDSWLCAIALPTFPDWRESKVRVNDE